MNSPPSHDPANDDSLLGMANTILRKFLQGVDGMLPASIVSYDRDTNRAVVQPMVAMLSTDGVSVPRAQIQGIPVLLLGGGGHMLSFNLKAGDFGWIAANDRDISLFMQSFTATAPNTLRFHSFEDAMFIPDAMRGYTINGEDDENVVLQTLDGKYRIAVWDSKIKITADQSFVEVDDAQITVQALNINLNGNVTSNGGPGTPNLNLTASNSVTITSPNVIINSPNIVLDGKQWQTHKHSGGNGSATLTGNPQ